MQVVIEISEEDYKTIVENGCYYARDNGFDLSVAIKNGTILPKGHGRLIDANALYVIPIDITDLPVDGCLSVCYVEDIDNAPTIIEAEKGAEE